jgi:hypothetical protein
MDPQAPDEETMVKVAVTDLDDRFESIERSKIEATVRPLVRDLLARAQVKTFVGIIAERRAKTELKKLARASEAEDDITAAERQTTEA